MARLLINNIKTFKQKGPYKIKHDKSIKKYSKRIEDEDQWIEHDIQESIKKHSKRIKDKDQWVARVYFDESYIKKYMYTLEGELLYKEYKGIVNIRGQECPEILPFDNSIKPIKNNDIVYCLYNNNYYIMIANKNDPNKGNKTKFIGLEDYPDDFTVWGIPQYFLSIVSDEDVSKLKLEYLYDMKKAYDEKRFYDLIEMKERYKSLKEEC